MDWGASFFQLEQRRDEIDAMCRVASGRIAARRASRKQQLSIFQSRHQSRLEDVILQNEKADERNSKLHAEIQNMHYTLHETKTRDRLLNEKLRVSGFTRPSAPRMSEFSRPSFTVQVVSEPGMQMQPPALAASPDVRMEQDALVGVANPGVPTPQTSGMGYAPRQTVTMATQTSPKVMTSEGVDDTYPQREMTLAVATPYTDLSQIPQQRTSAATAATPTLRGNNVVVLPPARSGLHATTHPRLPCDRPRAPTPNSRGHETYDRLRLFEREMQADLNMLQSLSKHICPDAPPICVEQWQQFPDRGTMGVSPQPPISTVDFPSRTPLPPDRSPTAPSPTYAAMERRLLDAAASAYDRTTGDVDGSRNASFAPVGTTYAASTLDARLAELTDARLAQQGTLFRRENEDIERTQACAPVEQPIVPTRDSSTGASRVPPSVWSNTVDGTCLRMNDARSFHEMGAARDEIAAKSTTVDLDDGVGMSENGAPALGRYRIQDVLTAHDNAAPPEGSDIVGNLLGIGEEERWPSSTQNDVSGGFLGMETEEKRSPRIPTSSASGLLGMSGGEKNASSICSDSVGGLLEMLGEEKTESPRSESVTMKEDGKRAPSTSTDSVLGILGLGHKRAPTPGGDSVSSAPSAHAKQPPSFGSGSMSDVLGMKKLKPGSSDDGVTSRGGLYNETPTSSSSANAPRGPPSPRTEVVSAAEPLAPPEAGPTSSGEPPRTPDSSIPPTTQPARDESPVWSSEASLPIHRQVPRAVPPPISTERTLSTFASSNVQATSGLPASSNNTQWGQQAARLQTPVVKANADAVEDALWRECEDAKPKGEKQSGGASTSSSLPPGEHRVKMKSNPLKKTGLILGGGGMMGSLRRKSSPEDDFRPAFSSDALNKLRPKQLAKSTFGIDFSKGRFPEDG
eukprot:GEMP01012529.1.p1 GENE.GEMP01012529.1~~GEMP01012529.1.p1  ORF type:complete len:912 (+),score=248.15 GEMP01012529.1:183-2918(+)